MQPTTPYTLNIKGQLLTLNRPLVMGILNATTESFYEASQAHTAESIAKRVHTIVNEGGDIIDIGACSTKPGLEPISEEEEMRRLEFTLPIVRATAPEAILSVDTFRARVAEYCIKEHGVHIINDVSSGKIDKQMFDTIANLNVPYVLTHNSEGTWKEIACDLALRIESLRLMGVSDIIVDPGFGFGKTLNDNYHLMAHLEEMHQLGCPILVGISRKSMIYKYLNGSPEEALVGTTVLHAVALTKGAHILRVHDVKAAMETIKIIEKLNSEH